MHLYHDEHGRLPPAVVYGADGKPLYSWRVVILPYLDHDNLFKQFKLDEPWDSPHNIKLLAKMPEAYRPPPSVARRMSEFSTICHVFVGKGTAFEGPEGLRLDCDFPDGTSNTFLIVEAGNPVLWTKPEDLPFDPHGPLPDLTGIHRDYFRASLADASVRNISRRISEKTLRAAITRNGDDLLGADWNN
jgi:Protein of unknown function (DUF1559)